MGTGIEFGLNTNHEVFSLGLERQLKKAADKFHVSEEDFMGLINNLEAYFNEPPTNSFEVFTETFRGERKLKSQDLKILVAHIDKLSGTGNFELTKNVLGWVHMSLVSNATYQEVTEYFNTRLSDYDTDTKHLSTTSKNKAINLERLSLGIGIIKRAEWGEIPVFGKLPSIHFKSRG